MKTTTTSPTGRSLTAICAATSMLIGITAASSAAAYADTAPASAAISYADIDVMTPEGARAVLARIETAASKICTTGLEHSPLTPRASAAFRTCTREAVATAATSLNSPAVLAELNAPAMASTTLASR